MSLVLSNEYVLSYNAIYVLVQKQYKSIKPILVNFPFTRVGVSKIDTRKIQIFNQVKTVCLFSWKVDR